MMKSRLRYLNIILNKILMPKGEVFIGKLCGNKCQDCLYWLQYCSMYHSYCILLIFSEQIATLDLIASYILYMTLATYSKSYLGVVNAK